MPNQSKRTAWLLTLLLTVVAANARGELRVNELVVGPATSDVVYVVSPVGGRVAAGMMKGSRFVVAVDGVEGPKVDSVMMVLPAAGVVSPGDPRSGMPGYTPKPLNPTPVVFSDDGKRFAYMARLGQEYVVIVDGQEQRRFPVAAGAQVRMQFTGPDAKNFLMSVSGGTGVFDVWVDGQQKPPHDANVVPVLSRDGSRYAYAADRTKKVLVVDGAPAGYTGEEPRFTGDGKHVLTVASVGSERAVLFDGAPAVKAITITRVFVAPAGDKFVAVVTKPGQTGQRYVCVIDGKEVAATEGTDQPFVVFSPNGKRWAARCRNLTGAAVTWLATDDGKKGPEYNGIFDESITFSPDGSRLAYVAGSGSKMFAVVDGQESEGFNSNLKVGFSPDGKRVYFGGRQDQPTVTRSLVVDGKVYRGDHNFNNESIAFSPDGSRWAAIGSGLKAGGPNGLQAVDNFLLDGQLIPGITASQFTFAPSGKHVAFIGQRRADGANALFLDDGQPLMLKMTTRGRPVVFSPDGNHLYWSVLQTDPTGGRPHHVIYADGKEVSRFDNVSLGNFETDPGAWQVTADGSLIAVGVVGENVIRYRVTPAADTSVATAAGDFTAAEAKAKSDADAAKQATVDAAAKKKADQEAAVKKQQDDAMKAREAALATRKAAAEERQRQREAAAAAAAKKAKPPAK